jgi:hypothetical protein
MYEITYNPKFVPRHSPKVNIKTITIDGKNRYFMKNHETGSLYDLSEFGSDLWNLVDGKRTVKEITEAMEGMYKKLRPDLVKESLLYYAEEGNLEAVLEPIKEKRVNIISAFMVRVSLIRESKEFLQSIDRVFRPLFRKPLLWLSVVFVTVMGLLFAGNFMSIFTNKANFEIMGSTVVGFFFYYFLVFGPIIAVHEIAHGLTLVHYGGEPREMGTGLYFFGPMFYVDVTDGWTLNRYQRIMIFAAGPLSTIMIGSMMMVVQYLWQFPASISHTLTMATFYCFYGLLADLSPLLESDGYYIFCDAVNIPDLREKSFTYLKTSARRLIKKSVKKENEALTTKTKAILLIYPALAVVWAVYLVYRSLMIATYMAQDTAVSVLNVSTPILLNKPLTIAAIVLCMASVVYFSMVMSGYGLMIFMVLKKAIRRTVRFEAIHDRDLSVFMYLPKNAPQSLFTSLRHNMAKAAKNFTHNFGVRQTGSMCVAVLRLSSANLALVHIRDHFRNIEKKFNDIYQSFLKRHKNEILESVWMYDPKKTSLAVLLSEMAKQAAKSGAPEAKTVVSQIIDRQTKTELYLLNSVYARVWTVELPPTLLHEMVETLLPTLLAEDLSFTDLYDEVEDFKKRTIYGFDSLAKLAIENQRDLQEALKHPEKYHVISLFEPIKGRLIFVGRTEQIEKLLDSLGGLFVCQVWCGYLDNLLSEVNLSLFAISRFALPTTKSVRSMKNGELAVLEKNISLLIDHEKFVSKSLKDLKRHSEFANLELEEIGTRLQSTGDFRVGLLDATLKMNTENLAHLPSQLESFRVLSHDLYGRIKKIGKSVNRELSDRKSLIAKKKRGRLAVSPIFIALSAILAFVGLRMFTDYITILFLVSALLLQFFYWTAYLLFSRSFNTVIRYPSPTFREVHLFTFAFTESLYQFMATANLLTPIETVSGRA